MRFLGACDASGIFEMSRRKRGAGSEVYSSTELVRRSVSDSAVIRKRMGLETSGPLKDWSKFVEGRILRRALAMAETQKPSDSR